MGPPCSPPAPFPNRPSPVLPEAAQSMRPAPHPCAAGSRTDRAGCTGGHAASHPPHHTKTDCKNFFFSFSSFCTQIYTGYLYTSLHRQCQTQPSPLRAASHQQGRSAQPASSLRPGVGTWTQTTNPSRRACSCRRLVTSIVPLPTCVCSVSTPPGLTILHLCLPFVWAWGPIERCREAAPSFTQQP